jgi:putative tryptophan/tyrosine transport system substrate-binding protein
MAIGIGRRQFISVLGGAAAAWPLAVRGQQPERMRRIGVMMGLAEDNREGRQEADALRQGLRDLGWTDGRNIRFDFHWDINEPSRAQLIAKDVVAIQPDLIVSHTTPATAAVFKLTRSIPIVFISLADPIGLGLVSNFARPGGNVTGFTNLEPSMGGKWVEVLKDIYPGIRRVAILFNPGTASAGGNLYLPSFKLACAALGVEPIESPAHNVAEIEQAIDALGREPNGGLVAMADISISLNRELIIRLAATNRLPLIAAFRFFPDEGGLVSYGPNVTDLFHRASTYVDRILKGEKPADLPVQAPTKFELALNLKTAKSLGLTVPQSLLAIADEVIE